MTTVNVRGATVEVRSLSVTKSLLKQVRVFKQTPPEPFCQMPPAEETLGKVRVLPEHVIGWFRGSVLGEEEDDFVLFLKDGDLVLGKMGRHSFRWLLPKECKQLYIA